MSSSVRKNKCPRCGELYEESRRECPTCNVSLIAENTVLEQDVVLSCPDAGLSEAERTFLSKARRYKNNDGKIDQEERNELVDLAMALGLSSLQRESLLERAESEYEKESSKLLRGDSSDGKDRRFAFLDWRRWRRGPLRHVRGFVGHVRNEMANLGIERPDENQAIGGVCAGIGSRFGVPTRLLRLIALAVAIWCPMVMLTYLVFWSLMPIRGERFVENKA